MQQGNSTCIIDDDVMVGNFGISLFASLAQGNGGGNLLVSPISIAMAMAIVLAGATPKSTCQSQLLELLGVSSHTAIPQLASRILPFTENNGGVQLDLATSVWTKGLLPSFVSLVEKTYPSATARSQPSTYKPINQWISDETKGTITKLFENEEQLMDPLTRGVLVNAVHFKGMWEAQFNSSQTKEGLFYPTPEEPMKVQYMTAQRKMNVAEVLPNHGGATGLRLDYVGNKYCALFLLPKDSSPESMSQTIHGLTTERLKDTLQKSFRHRDVNLNLVRFQMDWGPDSLVDVLRELGVTDVFDGRGVLNQMSDDPLVHLDQVLHQASMQVTEEGTVASAATAAIVKTRSLPPPPIDLSFNRPFVVMVLHKETATPLFVGKVQQPNSVPPSSECK